MMLTYSELVKFATFEDRLKYLSLDADPGEETFGPLRELNQKFYNSSHWKKVRQGIIARDLGNDLAIPGREIVGKIVIHHMNPIRPKDLYHNSPSVIDPENLITVSFDTHLMIHYGYEPEEKFVIERFKGDTKWW